MELIDLNAFDELLLSSGVGDENVNQFRIYFLAPRGSTAQTLAVEFQANFPSYFDQRRFRVVKGERRHGVLKTLMFTADVNGPDAHNDWVSICYQRRDDDCAGFAGQTLKRNFDDGTDSFIDLLPCSSVDRERLREINRHHFLAGRRSWVIAKDPPVVRDPSSIRIVWKDGGPPFELFFLDTAAVERSSAKTFHLLEEYPGLAWPMMGCTIRESIVEVWTNLLENYVKRAGHQQLPAISVRHRDWQRWGRVYVRQGDQASAAKAEILKLHPALGNTDVVL